MHATKTTPDVQYSDSPVYWFVRLDQARDQQDHELAAEAIGELRRLGVEIRFRREQPQRREATTA